MAQQQNFPTWPTKTTLRAAGWFSYLAILFAIAATASAQNSTVLSNATTTTIEIIRPPLINTNVSTSIVNNNTTHPTLAAMPVPTLAKNDTMTIPLAPLAPMSALPSMPVPMPMPVIKPIVVAVSATTFANYVVTWPNGTVCLMANLTATVHVSWNNTVDGSGMGKDIVFNSSTAQKVDGGSMCDMYQNKLQLARLDDANTTLTLIFRNVSADSNAAIALKEVMLMMPVDGTRFPNATPAISSYSGDNNNTNSWQVPRGQYFRCNNQDGSADLPDPTINKQSMFAQLMLGPNVVVQPFMSTNPPSTDWSSSVTQCTADDFTSEVVPIVVGIALAALIIIVLAAYFIGRRRSRRQVAIIDGQ